MELKELLESLELTEDQVKVWLPVRMPLLQNRDRKVRFGATPQNANSVAAGFCGMARGTVNPSRISRGVGGF